MTSKKNGQNEPENKDSQMEAEQNPTQQESAKKDDSVNSVEKAETTSEPSYETKLAEEKKASPDAKSESKPRSEPKPYREPKPHSEPKQSNKGSKLATLSIVLFALLAGGTAFVINQQSTQHKAQIAQLEAQIQSMGQKLEERMSSTEANATARANEAYNKAETVLSQQEKSIKSLQMALADVKGRRPNDWLLAESDYLVKLAGRKLFLEKDVVSATKLMESADQRISVLNDPSLVPLRKEMAKDITTLKSVALVDKDGLALRLISLQQQVDVLPLANAILPDAPVEETNVVSEDINDWKENLMTSLKDFSEQFITFRTRDGNVIPLLSPKQHYYLKENIKGKIETAIRAIYNENQEIYESSLKTADQWAMQFFRLEDPAVKQFDESIKQLSGKQVEVKYPVKLVSQKALNDVINERLRREVTSMTTEEQQ